MAEGEAKSLAHLCFSLILYMTDTYALGRGLI